MFDHYLKRWNLTPEGDAIITPGSDLLPVRWDGQPAMLKIAREPEEKLGGELMTWWAGKGAARVFFHDGDAVVMERATGPGSLMHMALNGQDDEASRIACATVALLHAPRPSPPAGLHSLGSGSAPCGSPLRVKAGGYASVPPRRAACWRHLRNRWCCTVMCTTTTSSISAPGAGWRLIPSGWPASVAMTTRI